MTEYICHILVIPVVREKYTPARLFKQDRMAMTRLLRKVVRGMLPKNKLGAKLLGNMYVYAGSEHKHASSEPQIN
jgi:large subunit ribosomal protein L13